MQKGLNASTINFKKIIIVFVIEVKRIKYKIYLLASKVYSSVESSTFTLYNRSPEVFQKLLAKETLYPLNNISPASPPSSP